MRYRYRGNAKRERGRVRIIRLINLYSYTPIAILYPRTARSCTAHLAQSRIATISIHCCNLHPQPHLIANPISDNYTRNPHRSSSHCVARCANAVQHIAHDTQHAQHTTSHNSQPIASQSHCLGFLAITPRSFERGKPFDRQHATQGGTPTSGHSRIVSCAHLHNTGWGVCTIATARVRGTGACSNPSSPHAHPLH
jgi:hypothetical protein